MSDQAAQSQAVTQDEIKEVIADGNAGKPRPLSLEALTLLITTERLKTLHSQTQSEFKELKKRQEQVHFLHKLMKAINKATTAQGEFDCSSNEDIKKMLTEAKNMGVDLADDKFKYNKDERDRMVENVRMTIEDYNVQNEMQMQTVNRLTNERYESYQMARSILKPLHDAKMNIVRNIKN